MLKKTVDVRVYNALKSASKWAAEQGFTKKVTGKSQSRKVREEVNEYCLAINSLLLVPFNAKHTNKSLDLLNDSVCDVIISLNTFYSLDSVKSDLDFPDLVRCYLNYITGTLEKDTTLKTAVDKLLMWAVDFNTYKHAKKYNYLTREKSKGTKDVLFWVMATYYLYVTKVSPKSKPKFREVFANLLEKIVKEVTARNYTIQQFNR